MNTKVLSIGNASVDIKAFCYEDDGTEAYREGIIDLVAGGVGRGMAMNLKNLGLDTAIYSVVGNDIFGDFLKKEFTDKHIDASLLKTSTTKKTALFSIMASPNKPANCVYSTDVLEEIEFSDTIKKYIHKEAISTFCLDSNMTDGFYKDFYDYKINKDFFVFQNATAPDICRKLLPYAQDIDLYACNEFEAASLLGKEAFPDTTTTEEFRNLGFKNFIITFGEQGVMVHINGETWNEKPYAQNNIVDTIGAGDAFAAGFLMGFLEQQPVKRCIQYGLACSKETLHTRETVNNVLTAPLVKNYPDHT